MKPPKRVSEKPFLKPYAISKRYDTQGKIISLTGGKIL